MPEDAEKKLSFEPARIAFNAMLNEQDASIYEAAFYLALFAAHSVEDSLGRKSRARLLDNIMSEMDKHSDRMPALPELLEQGRIAIPIAEHHAAKAGKDDADDEARGRIMARLQALLRETKADGITDVEVPPVLADFGGMIALALGRDRALLTLIMRMESMLDDYMERRPPFDVRR